MSKIKFNFNENIFKNIDDIRFIYYLGLLWADGYNKKYTTEIVIKKEDFENLKHIFDDIKEIDFSYTNIKRENRKEQACIRVNRKSFSSFLEANDFNDKNCKSPSKILSLIPKEKRIYFFRGLIDGDGCFYHKNKMKQFSITSSLNQDWSYIEELFNELGVCKFSIRNVNDKNSYSQIRISNIHDIKKLCDYVYDDISNKIFLERKYNKYKDMLNSSDLNKKRQFININIDELNEQYNSGKSVKELAKLHNCGEKSIYRRLKSFKTE